MIKKVKREVSIYICDGCGTEVSHICRCCICGKDFCNLDGGKGHFTYSMELYRYEDGKRSCSTQVCKECDSRKADMSIAELINLMMSNRIMDHG